MINITDKTKCCGCTACYSICPKNAIEMTFDDEGFRYPRVSTNKCIDCGLCNKVCPETESYSRHGSRNSVKYAAQNLSEKERKQSTAGGFFSVIADYVINDCSGFVFAVGFDESVAVIHKKANKLSELNELRGSKYVQSDLKDTFKQVKLCLTDNKTCLFVGTPCQVNAIEKFLSKNEMRKNLITIDLLCLGVSSPALYEKWLTYLKNKYKDNVKRVYFREKSYGYATANVRICFENRKHIEQCYDAKSLMNTFFKGYNMRPSCYDCSFRCAERASDFTIGDFHQIGKIAPEMDDDKGTTCVWAHSEKAQMLTELLKEKMRMELIEDNCSNRLFDKSKVISIPSDRSLFFEDSNSMKYEEFIAKWSKNSLKGKLINIARVVVNKLPFRSVVFKAMKQIKTKKFQKRVNAVNKATGEDKSE